MNGTNWKIELREWVKSNLNIIDLSLERDFEYFFEYAFKYARYPERSWFGIHNSRVSLVIGGIYLAAIQRSGEGKGIWLLIDKNHSSLSNLEFRPVKSTISSEHPLIWAHSPLFSEMPSFIKSVNLWDSYSVASEKILSSPISKDRDSTQQKTKKKKLIDLLFLSPKEYIDREFEKSVNKSIQESQVLRKKRLMRASTIPVKTEVTSFVYNRNPDVVAEVLYRANGFCENCGKPAPFVRRSDSTPYLEVHHKQLLAHGGEDAVNNAVALCPNCHREAHFS